MKKRLIRKTFTVLMLCVAVLAAGGLMFGCAGDNGAAGAPGAPGAPGTPGTNATVSADYTATIDSVTTATSGTAVTFTINFTIKELNGARIPEAGATSATNATRLAYLRFAYAKLTAGAAAGDSSLWTSYNQGERSPASLTDNGNGTYTYVCSPIDAAVFAAGAPTRVGMQVTLTGRNAKNEVYDFVPNGTAATLTREIVTTAACDACHAAGAGKAHGTRFESKYCAVCHTLPTTRNGHTVDYKSLIHEIHTAQTTSALDASGVTYPQEIRNCTTCHKGGANSDNWKTVPTAAACGSCHTTVPLATGGTYTRLNDTSGTHSAQPTNSGCALCHTATDIVGYHTTEVATENNPSVPAGAANFTYVISSVTVTNTTQPVIKFTILKDGLATTFTGTGSTASTPPADAVLAGFSGSPSFLIAYADGTRSTIDHNNLGKSAAQPASVSIAYLLVSGATNTRGTITGPVSGEYTATITDPAYGFPAGSTLRTVALQGYFTQDGMEASLNEDLNGDGDLLDGLARHSVSVVKEVAGETRRSIVDPAKCAKCHEIFEGHGGNRNISKDTTGTIVCVLCHVPNLSSSGTTVNLTNAEATQNMKDMTHAIHAAGVRNNPYVHYRAKSGAATRYDWSDVTYPGDLNKCETCHKPGTYDADLPAGVSMTTDRVGSAATTTTEVATLRATVDNLSDNVTTPVTSTCVACHDSDAAKAHMTSNGGQISVLRSSATGVEQCTVCHGAGRSADIAEMHK